MKSNSDVRPPIILNLGDGSFHYNYNIKEVEVNNEGVTKTVFEYDTVQVWGNPDYDKCVRAVIRDKYDENEELNLINKYNANSLGIADNNLDEYKEYLIFLLEIKEMIKNNLPNDNILQE